MRKSLFLGLVVALSGTLSAQLKFNHLFDKADFEDPTVVVATSYSPSFSDGSVVFNRSLDLTSGTDAYVDIALEGAPLSISFELKNSHSTAAVLPITRSYMPMCWLSESSDGVNYTLTRTWRQSLGEVSTTYQTKNVSLKAETRFIRIGYRATRQCNYHNIIVTPLHADLQLNVSPDALDFGRMAVNKTDHSDDKKMSLNVNWRNLKNITVAVESLNSDVAKGMYSTDKNTLGTTEISNGNSTLVVTNNPNADRGEYYAKDKNGAMVRFRAKSSYENDERIASIPLSVMLCPRKRTITWYENQDTVYVRNNVTLESATINPTGATISYRELRTKGSATINTSSLQTSAIPTMGIVEMEAYCDGTGSGTNAYADASVKRVFVVLPEHGMLYETSLCEGESIEIGGQTIVADGNKTQTITLPTEDQQNDSTIFVILWTNKVYTDVQTSARVHQDDLPFMWEGLTFTKAGSQKTTIKTQAGCDSTVTMTLQVDTSYHVYKQVCKNEFPIEWKVGDDVLHTFTDYGKYTYTFEKTVGDSSVTWFVTPHDPIYATPDVASICAGSSYKWREKEYSTTGVYYDTIQGNCEFTYYTLDLTVLSPDTIEPEYSTICAADTADFNWHGQTYVEGKTVYYDTVRYEVTGCDSAYYQLNLTVLTTSFAPAVDSVICAVDTATFTWRDKQYVSGQTTYLDTAYYETGCDSVYYQLNLTVLTTSFAPAVDSVICAVDTATFTWRDKQYVSGQTTYLDTAYYAYGCDSVYYQLNLEVLLPTTLNPVDTTICEADTANFTWRRHAYVSGQTVYKDTMFASIGCDSIYSELHLKLSQSLTADTNAWACKSFTWYGTKYTKSDNYAKTFVTKGGCDSIVTLHLTIYQPVTNEFADTTCPAKPYVWEGDTYTKTGDYMKTLATSRGCDSIVTLHLLVATPNPDLDPTLDQVPASNKFDAWLLMVDRAAVEDTYHLTPSEKDITWYRVVGQIDSQMDDAVKDDEKVGQGFYYTDDRRLSGSYYALMTIPNEMTQDKCGAIYRSMVLDAAQAQSLQLVPSRVAANQTMQLIHVDGSATTISIYSSTGQLIRTIYSEHAHTIDIQAEHAVGMYLVKVQNEQQQETLKYIVGQ